MSEFWIDHFDPPACDPDACSVCRRLRGDFEEKADPGEVMEIGEIPPNQSESG